MKICNAKASHVFVQLGCKNLQDSLSETCTHLVQATYLASGDWGIVHARAHHHTPPKKSHNTQPLLCHLTMADAPIVPSFEKSAREGAGAALAMSNRRALTPHAGPRWCHGQSRGRRGRDGNGEGENGGEAALIPSLVGLRRRWTTRMRMTVAAGRTKQQPTP